MTSGGARARSGPAPDPNALRRTRDAKEWIKLKREGRGDVPAPEWPLEPPPEIAALIELYEQRVLDLREDWLAAEDKRTASSLGKKLAAAEESLTIMRSRESKREEQELALWAKLWTYPQAVVWEADFQHLNVAMYVRSYLEAARPDAKATNRTLARQYADILLLTEPSLHAHKYVIDVEIQGATDPDLVATSAGQNKPAAPRPGGARGGRFLKAVKPPEDDEGDAS